MCGTITSPGGTWRTCSTRRTRSRWGGAPTRCPGPSATTSPAGHRSCATARSPSSPRSIAQMNTGRGPDLLGVCEVENRFVLDRLVDGRATQLLPVPRSYAVVHADTDDARGIDVAFIYDDTLFEVPRRRGVGVLPRGDAPQRHPRDRPGQLRPPRRRPGPGRCSATTGPPAAAASSSRPATAPSPARPSATSTSGSSRSTARTPRCSRWATSTTSRSTPPWSATR